MLRLAGKQASRREQGCEHAERDLTLAHDDVICTEVAQVLDFRVGMRARNHAQRGLHFSRLCCDLTSFEAVGDRDEDRVRVAGVGGGEDLG